MIGEKLRQKRIMSGWSLQRLADKLERQGTRITRAALSKYELEKATPNALTLYALAQVFDVKTDYFFSNPSATVTWQSFRKKASVSQVKIDSLKAIAEEKVENILMIENVCGVISEPSVLPRSREEATPEEAENMAEELRSLWNLDDTPIQNLCELLESKGIILVPITTEGNGVDGFVGNLPNNRKIIVYAKDKSVDRTRLTICHELGHLLLSSTEPKINEHLAHRFSGAFLVPAERLRQILGTSRTDISIQELCLMKERFGISIQALTYRAKDLGILSRSAYQTMFINFRSKGIYSEEPGHWPYPEEPRLTQQYLFRAVAEGLISESRAQELFPDYLTVKEQLEDNSSSAVNTYLSLSAEERSAYLSKLAEESADMYAPDSELLADDIMDVMDG
ncbi:helix-turn-helix domain-containing protein [Sediminispirochaeta bajacaliforniensis]|uniref:helix-turn-helix domain-containing protein n=1 Tax=Sediminispirochaeta bajacaliforniensis TaxID=148 RepID=UPI0003603E03|nr:XRE family transcriptional regulator [Sediminispirochaeta bajacaliforniensis]